MLYLIHPFTIDFVNPLEGRGDLNSRGERTNERGASSRVNTVCIAKDSLDAIWRQCRRYCETERAVVRQWKKQRYGYVPPVPDVSLIRTPPMAESAARHVHMFLL